MAEPVKTRRSYDPTRRREQARRTRAAVLDAARRTFLDEGYSATTIAAVAREAGVSVDTIYKQFRGKAGLLKAVYDVAIVGDDEPVPMVEREHVRRWMTDPDVAGVIREYCEVFARTAVDVVPMLMLVRAAAGDPEADRLWAAIRAERLTGMAMFAENLHTRELLRPALPVATARDILWVYTAPELYEMLVVARGWTVARYGRFLADALIAALLPADAPPGPQK